MKIVKENIENPNSERTLVLDEESGQHFLVSSTSEETLIFKSDSEGNILNDFVEVWETIYLNHSEVIELLSTGQLTTDYFYNMS